MKTNVANYSIWMTPEEPDLTELSNQIACFADSQGTPPFVPHLTLIGDIVGEEQELTSLFRRLSSGISAHCLTVVGANIEDLFFKSIYLELSFPIELVHERAALINSLSFSDHTLDFQPHISLAYGEIEPEIKALEIGKLRQYVGRCLKFRYLHLVNSSKTVPIENWKILETFTLR